MFYKFESLACNVDARPHRTNTERIIEVIRREESTKLNVLMNTNISSEVTEIHWMAINVVLQLLRAEIPALG